VFASLAAEVAVLVAADSRPTSLAAPDGSPAVAVFTAAAHLGPLVNFGVAAMPMAELLPLVPRSCGVCQRRRCRIYHGNR
jgi:hypothetical protein